jgi:hypothetical protein
MIYRQDMESLSCPQQNSKAAALRLKAGADLHGFTLGFRDD